MELLERILQSAAQGSFELSRQKVYEVVKLHLMDPDTDLLNLRFEWGLHTLTGVRRTGNSS